MKLECFGGPLDGKKYNAPARYGDEVAILYVPKKRHQPVSREFYRVDIRNGRPMLAWMPPMKDVPR